ncbi:MAG: adenylyl-sulfate reductase subunit alpha [Desulfovibrio sp.]|jgi:adenylylsulfate reductase subunit A|nr:adenylyl-sulfate reductase subunit alpha [Desulfovibrio sp.]
MDIRHIDADILILGGGTAGCWAALCAARASAGKGLRIVIAEKARIERSGCLAAGVNAINAYIGEGRCPQDYVDYARKDAAGIVRGDLLLSMAEGLNESVRALEALGLVILKDETGGYAQRGWRNVKINGENIKPLLAAAVRAQDSVTVLERVNVCSYLVEDDTILGAVAFGVTEKVCYALRARAVICATGGAAGLYRPNSPGFARHSMWYPPFNTGAGHAMGILAGAEMTSLEMRFVALRCKGSVAPAGTLAQGAGARQMNSLGQVYEHVYGLTTAQRVYGTRQEELEGRGPCVLRVDALGPGEREDLYKAYLNMAPLQTLRWVEEEAAAGEDMNASSLGVAVEGTEPYVNGGHTAGGYWVDSRRQTSIRGLFAAGDVAGGSPQKYVSGAMAEAAIAATAALGYAREVVLPAQEAPGASFAAIFNEARDFLERPGALFTVEQLEEAMQQNMDEYAGGIASGYRYNDAQLDRAEERVRELTHLSGGLRAPDMRDLLRIYELRERLVLCRSLIAHLKARRESRWPGFGEHTQCPGSAASGLRYVNSRLEKGEIRIIFRDLVSEGECYEHSD